MYTSLYAIVPTVAAGCPSNFDRPPGGDYHARAHLPAIDPASRLIAVSRTPTDPARSLVAQPPVADRTRVGTLAVTWERDPPEGDPRPLRPVLADDGTTIRLQLGATAKAQALALNGRQVVVAGSGPAQAAPGDPVWLVDELRPVDGRAPTAPDRVRARNPSSRSCYRFPDIAAAHKPADYFQGMYGADAPALNHYWPALSYGAIGVDGNAAFGPYTLPQPSTHYLPNDSPDLTALAKDCAAAADADVAFPACSGVNLTFNADIGCCAWAVTSP